MFNQDLVDSLIKFPKDMLVLVDGYEGDFQLPLKPRVSKFIKRKGGTTYWGDYEEAENGDIDAIVIERS